MNFAGIFRIIAIFFLFSQAVDAQPGKTGFGSVENQSLFQMAVKSSGDRAEYALRQGAKCLITPDKRSFYILWFPPGKKDHGKIPMIATISGHASWAFDEFFMWHKHAAKHGFGIIALQWWFGTGEKMNDYYFPRQVYEQFSGIFQIEGIQPGTSILHGFSRGSANIYGVTAFDCKASQRLFAMTIANSGKAGQDFPVNRDIAQGKFGSQPFAGTHWIMFGGGKDPHPDRDGITGMHEAEAWVKKLGGTVDLFIADQNADHGGFHRNGDNTEAALNAFEKLIKR